MMERNPLPYYGKKLAGFLFSVLLLSMAAFYIARLAPGDPLYAYYGDRVEKMSLEERERAEERLGLKDPVFTQYARWLQNALRGDFGISYQYKTDVLEVIGGRLGNTLILGGTGFVLVFVLALGLGLFCAWQEGRWPDRLLCKLGSVASCIPEFWLSLALILIFAVNLRWLPSGGAYSIGNKDDLQDRLLHLVLPMAVVVAGHLWYYAYIIRSRLLGEARRDYVLLAKAKGLSSGKVLVRHCLRNALPAYLSLMAVSIPHILGGTYIVETVFSYPGIGTLSYESARYQDYNLLMVLCILSGAVVMLGNTAAQIINQRLDPRMRDSGQERGEVGSRG